jgi:hypothetical protein
MRTVVNILAVAVLLSGGCISPQESSSRIGYDFAGVDKVAIVAVEGAVTSEAAVQVGLILDVPAVFAIKIPHFGEEISITAQMINVEDGSTLWLASGSGKGKRALSNVFGFGSKGRSNDQLLGDVMGGPSPLGGPVALPLTPEEAEKAQGIIKSMCRSLPAQSGAEW